MKEINTPLIRQYLQIKGKYPDYILLYRIGDFYETFFDDAEITSRVCNIVLTKRNNGAAGEVPLAGFPFHQLDNYLPKLVNAGYRVAVCEQVEDPKKAKGIVRREVVEIVTPGVTLYDRLLSEKRNNYICSVFFRSQNDFISTVLGVAFCDVSTGEFYVSEMSFERAREFLEVYQIKEIVVSKSQKNLIEELLNKIPSKPVINKLEHWIFDYTFAKEALLGQFKTITLKGFGIESYHLGITAAGALLYYIKETQSIYLNQIRSLRHYNPNEFMLLDAATRRNLELFPISEKGDEASLFSIFDDTLTPMGARLLKRWFNQPLLELERINSRQAIVDFFYQNIDFTKKIREHLRNLSDLERLVSKVCSFKATPRELLALKNTLENVKKIKENLAKNNVELILDLSKNLLDFPQITSLVVQAIREDAGNNVGEGNVIRKGFDEEFDKLLEFAQNWKSLISAYQDEERKKSQIPTLKIGFNNVFGYYIEVTKVHSEKVPDYFERKQTLTNAERYTTQKLRELESKIVNLQIELDRKEKVLYETILRKISEYANDLQVTARNIAELDCYTNLAYIAKKYNYCKPQLHSGYDLEIRNGRHPVVERNLPIGEKYTPNDTLMTGDSRIHIITGPNMSGKSCYLRQVALIVLLSQIGSFVPADYAKVGLVDRIFTRVGAQDYISSGESTFLVEMQEAANILNNATKKSLILLDEVGRGTATFDGISIAWAITEYIHNNIGAKTLFATHFHELNELESKYDFIENYYVEVYEEGDKVIFTHKVKRGNSDHSFGIYVAEMAGVPKKVVSRAKEILTLLESGTTNQKELIKINKPNPKKVKAIEKEFAPRQLAIFDFSDSDIREKIAKLDLDNITPIRALQILEELQREIREGR
ncbi:MAG: DNA mismatch repair protein MutS [Ignavibacteria bacterium]|nr:DNA mismatch repair protein MutS [Ignavibacteria bacterium]